VASGRMVSSSAGIRLGVFDQLPFLNSFEFGNQDQMLWPSGGALGNNQFANVDYR
jgi:hypothetical protein